MEFKIIGLILLGIILGLVIGIVIMNWLFNSGIRYILRNR